MPPPPGVVTAGAIPRGIELREGNEDLRPSVFRGLARRTVCHPGNTHDCQAKREAPDSVI